MDISKANNKSRWYEWSLGNITKGCIRASIPQQAAKKAYVSILKYMKKEAKKVNQHLDFNQEIYFTIKERTVGSSNNEFNYIGSKVMIRDTLTPQKIEQYKQNLILRETNDAYRSKPILLYDPNNLNEIIGISVDKKIYKQVNGVKVFDGYKTIICKYDYIVKKIPIPIAPLIVK